MSGEARNYHNAKTEPNNDETEDVVQYLGLQIKNLYRLENIK